MAASGRDKSDVKIVLEDINEPEAYAYVAFVYLHPSSVPFNGSDEQFRDKYLIGHYSQWINPHAAHEGGKREFSVTADLANYPELRLAEGTPLTATIAIHVDGRITDAEAPAGTASDVPEAPSKALPSLADDSRIGSARLE